MIKVPVLFGHHWKDPIGTLEIDETRLPPGAAWHLSLGYKILETDSSGRATRIELVDVSPTEDASFAYEDGRAATPVGEPRR
jgi:hypothetical protein